MWDLSSGVLDNRADPLGHSKEHWRPLALTDPGQYRRGQASAQLKELLRRGTRRPTGPVQTSASPRPTPGGNSEPVPGLSLRSAPRLPSLVPGRGPTARALRRAHSSRGLPVPAARVPGARLRPCSPGSSAPRRPEPQHSAPSRRAPRARVPRCGRAPGRPAAAPAAAGAAAAGAEPAARAGAGARPWCGGRGGRGGHWPHCELRARPAPQPRAPPVRPPRRS